ncbi:hypothetical protein A3Q29_13800 [Providencia stuartii]|uniref:Uncharacterized protein n=1 Tax=Providencia stuartii TaxID=588 RepID=A0A1S1HYE8_PROST|nr:hypothetical protein A3Q29_13800 [Providencia stuartii]
MLFLSFFLASNLALADCNFKKAARNKMLDQKIGLSGNCDTEKAVKTQATKKVDDNLGVDSKKIQKDITDKKNNVENKVSNINKTVDKIK